MLIGNILNVLSDNVNFDIIVETIVLMGIILTRFVLIKPGKRKEMLLKLLLVFCFFVFFNLAFIVDVFSVPQIPIFVIMGISAALAMILILIFLFRYPNKVNKRSNIVLLVTMVLGIPFYIVEVAAGIQHHIVSDLIETGLMLTILVSLFNAVVSFLIKEGLDSRNQTNTLKKRGPKKK